MCKFNQIYIPCGTAIAQAFSWLHLIWRKALSKNQGVHPLQCFQQPPALHMGPEFMNMANTTDRPYNAQDLYLSF